MLLQKVTRKLTTKFVKPLLAKYLRSTRIYNHKPFKLIILPGVFHPAFFFSTKYLLAYLNKLNLNNKKILDVGAGNGLISFCLSKKAGEVVAIEISNVAIKGLKMNYENNRQFIPDNSLKIIQSNLFSALQPCKFDLIIVNPPYYPNTAKNEEEMAWNCGPDFEYFHSFFNRVSDFMGVNSILIMVLSNQCNLSKIKQIALENGFMMQLKHSKNFVIEENYIFEFKRP